MNRRVLLGLVGTTLAIASGGCVVPAPSAADLTRESVAPLDYAEQLAGDYDNDSGNGPAASLWTRLRGEDERPRTTPAGTHGIHVDVHNGHLTARPIGPSPAVSNVVLPLAFENGYFRGRYAGYRPADAHVMGSYQAVEIVVARRSSDDALVVVSSRRAWGFPFPGDSGPGQPFVTAHPRRPATRPSDKD